MYCFVYIAQSGCAMSINQYGRDEERVREMSMGGKVMQASGASSLRAGRKCLQLTALIKAHVILQW